jgi:LytS/YehU family sensor histidine kinase
VIDHLAGFLQYTLRHLRMEWVSLAEEIEHAEHYLALERLRLGERIEIAASYPEESQDLAVPSLVLLPLLENAVKHGFGTVTETGLLEIRISIEDRFLRILVRNPFDATVPGRTGGEGLGLSVLQQRLIGLYRRPVGMKTESADHHFQIVLELPKMRRNDVGPDLSGR